MTVESREAMPMDDADPPTVPGRRVSHPAPLQGWRSVVIGGIGIGALASLVGAGRDVSSVAPWVAAIVGWVVVGKDARAIVEVIGAAMGRGR